MAVIHRFGAAPVDPSIGCTTSIESMGSLRRQLDELAGGVEAIGDPPRGRRVAVDRHRGAVLGAVREHLAVGAGASRHRSGLDGDGLRCRRRTSVEHLETLIGAVERGDPRLVAAGLGEPAGVLAPAPLAGLVAVRVGDDQAVGVDRRREIDGVTRGVDDQLGPVDQPGRRGVDDTVAAARRSRRRRSWRG